MGRRALFLSLLTLVTLACPATLHASVKSFDDLSSTQILALQDSEQRLQTYDHALQALEVARTNHKISRQEYGYEEHDLTAFIAAEASFQNAILIKDKSGSAGAAVDASEVMQNVGKYAAMVACGALKIGLAFLANMK